MSAAAEKRYGWQIGDDGRWLGESNNKPEAVAAAAAVSRGEMGRSQLVDFQTGEFMQFRNGVRVA